MKFTKSIFMYMRGDDVLDVQVTLKALNDYEQFSFRKLDENGYFGLETVHFVRDFQNKYGLAPTGAFDFATYQVVEQKWADMMSRLRSAKTSQPAWLNQRKWR